MQDGKQTHSHLDGGVDVLRISIQAVAMTVVMISRIINPSISDSFHMRPLSVRDGTAKVAESWQLAREPDAVRVRICVAQEQSVYRGFRDIGMPVQYACRIFDTAQQKTHCRVPGASGERPV